MVKSNSNGRFGGQICLSCSEFKDLGEFPPKMAGLNVPEDHCRACLARAIAFQSLRSNHLLQAAAAHLTKVCVVTFPHEAVVKRTQKSHALEAFASVLLIPIAAVRATVDNSELKQLLARDRLEV